MGEIRLKHGAKLELHIAIGRNRQETKWKNKTVTWTELLERISETTRTYETAAEYRNMGKNDQDRIKDVGGFVGGILTEGRRKNGFVKARSIITLDADFATPDLWEDTAMLTTYAIAAYSTHKHNPEHPRLRFLIPLSRDVTPDEYEATARWIANEIGIDYFDDTTYEPARLMYWPSTSKDAEYFFEYADAPVLDPDKVLAKYTDWRDTSNWPESSRSKGLRKKAAEKQGDPLAKSGLIGAFCRSYTIQDVIATFLPEIYTECNTPGRYTYNGGSTAAGLVVYDDKFAYSNHATDPASGQLCNAFDLVRIHLFGEDDIDAKADTPVNKLPSWGKMMELVGQDENVRATIGEEKIAQAKAEFGDDFQTGDDNEWLKKLKTNKAGGYEPTISNLKLILQNDPNLKGIRGRDRFSDRYIVEGSLPWKRESTANTWTDTDDAGLRDYIESVYGIEAKGKLIDALALIFEERAFHPVKDFIEEQTWDGTPRVETVLIDYLGAKDTPYVRAFTRKTLVAAIARVYNPGCKFDYMLTIVGRQGVGKTLLVKQLAHKWGSNTLSDIRGKESYEALDGVWIMEMGELAALKKGDRDAIKNYISKQEDTYRKAYARNVTTSKRHTIFIGTTNESTFLEDDTGNRRYWVVDTDETKRKKTVWDDLTLDEVHQIWAEALEIYRAGENIMALTDDEQAAAKKEQDMHTSEDPYMGLIQRYLEIPLPDGWDKKTKYERAQYYNTTETFHAPQTGTERTKVSAIEIWTECMQKSDSSSLTRAEVKRIYSCLEKLGWVKSETTMRIGGEYGTQKGFIKPEK